MIINFSNEKAKTDKNTPKIFFAGPTKRDSSYILSWRKEGIDILKALNFKGIVHIPEYSPGESFSKEFIKRQTYWEWECLDNSDVIVFWIPRELKEMPAFTTNIEFGIYIERNPNKIVLGYPLEAAKMDYLALLYEERTKRKPNYTLYDTLVETLNILKK